MAKPLAEWIDTDIREVKDKPLSWLSANYFFRDPPRGTYSDLSLFFAPADGVIVYQKFVRPGEPLLAIKGQPYSLQEAMRDQTYDKPSLVIGVFMTFYDVHVNRVPYPGALFYRLLDRIDTHNHPMLDVERSLLEELRVPVQASSFLRHNQRVLNRFFSPALGAEYYVLQIADYDVDCITPFTLKQGVPYSQGQRFSQIRYGSQVDLIIPMLEDLDLEPLQRVADHVEAGVDALVRIHR